MNTRFFAVSALVSTALFATIGFALPWLFLWPYTVQVPGTWTQPSVADVRGWTSMSDLVRVFTVRAVGRVRVFVRYDPSFHELNESGIQNWSATREVIDEHLYSRRLNLELFERQAYDKVREFSPLVSSVYTTPTDWMAFTRRCRSAQVDEVGWPVRWLCIVRTAGPAALAQTDANDAALSSVPSIEPLSDVSWITLLYAYQESGIRSGLRDGGTVIAWRIAWEALIVNMLFWLTCGAVVTWFFREIVRSVAWRFFAQRRLKQGRCARCGYPALKSVMEPTGTESEPPKCPECGLPVGALPGGWLGTRPIMVHR